MHDLHVTILHDDEEMKVPVDRALELVEQGLIEPCFACSNDELDPDIFHPTEGHNWADIEEALGIEEI